MPKIAAGTLPGPYRGRGIHVSGADAPGVGTTLKGPNRAHISQKKAAESPKTGKNRPNWPKSEQLPGTQITASEASAIPTPASVSEVVSDTRRGIDLIATPASECEVASRLQHPQGH